MEDVGAGIGASLRAVDCAANEMAQAALSRLFDPGGAFATSFTVLLTLFVALLGFGLITGRARISLSSLTPQMFALVAVVSFATSFVLFQTVFWNIAVLGPDWIASSLMGTEGSATTIFADKLDVVMFSLMQASGGEAMGETTSVFSPPGLLWTGGTMLLLGTVGVLATCKIALAALMAIGPIFIVLALFRGTRGLFVGWLKGVAMVALAPLFAVLGGSLMLELSTPVLAELALTPGRIDVRPAMAFFMIGAVHLALMFMVMKVASTMVRGWSVFGLSGSDRGDDARTQALSSDRAPSPALTQSNARERAMQPATQAPARDIRVATSGPMAANDSGGGGSNTYVTRETKIMSGAAAGGGSTDRTQVSRARGIGSRFKSAPNRTTEKTKP